MPVASFCCLYSQLWSYFTPGSSVSIVNFEHVIAGWVWLPAAYYYGATCSALKQIMTVTPKKSFPENSGKYHWNNP